MRGSTQGSDEMKQLRHKVVMVLALTTSVVGAFPHTAEAKDKHKRWTVEWFQNHHHPSAKYWDKVAQCETHSNWKDKGNFAGGLGIATTTWRNYGGYQFANHPSRATRVEQIRVANRVAVRGFIRKDGSFQLPAGFGGWGCIRNNTYLRPPDAALWYKWRHYA